jgi:hypothetical protein
MKTKLISSERIVIDVKPLPENGKPASFNGLVGKHEFDLKVTKSQLLINEPLEMRLTISGDGNLENLETVELVQDEKLEKFDSKSDLNLVNSDNAIKTFDYTFLAKKPGVMREHNIEMSYFDPDQERYLTVIKQIPEIFIAGPESLKPVASSPREQDGNNSVEDKKVPAHHRFIFSKGLISSSLFLPAVLVITLLSLVSVLRGRLSFQILSRNTAWAADFKKIESGMFGSAELLRVINQAEFNLPDEARIYFKNQLAECERNEFRGISNKFEKIYLNRKMLRVLKRSLRNKS